MADTQVQTHGSCAAHARRLFFNLIHQTKLVVSAYHAACACRLITYRQRFARAAPAPRAKRFEDSKNRVRASPVNACAHGPSDMIARRAALHL